MRTEGRYSRRHDTDAAHRAARDRWFLTKSKQVKRERAERRQQAADERTPLEQGHRLDARFGIALGAIRERWRLNTRIWTGDNLSTAMKRRLRGAA